jgi:hypothetical protein
MQFHLHGWLRPNLEERCRALRQAHTNVQYHGAYTTADLPAILGAYRITLAPYLMDSVLTRYIDPLRFYHCLNTGMEVVSTDIPQARLMGHWVHVVRDPNECADTLAAIQAGTAAKQPGYEPTTWEQRARRLVYILRALPRTRALAARRPRHPAVDMTAAGAGTGSAAD